MRLLGLLIIYLSRICARVGGLFKFTEILNSLLPSLMPAEELTRLIRVHYERHVSQCRSSVFRRSP